MKRRLHIGEYSIRQSYRLGTLKITLPRLRRTHRTRLGYEMKWRIELDGERFTSAKEIIEELRSLEELHDHFGRPHSPEWHIIMAALIEYEKAAFRLNYHTIMEIHRSVSNVFQEHSITIPEAPAYYWHPRVREDDDGGGKDIELSD